MNLTKKKVILISSSVAAIVCISGALMFSLTANLPGKNTKSDEYLTTGHSLSQKKRFSENMEYAEKYNKRIEEMDKLGTPTKSSTIPDPDQIKNAENSNQNISLYFLFDNKSLNTDQYIDAENKVNTAVNNLKDIVNCADLNKYFYLHKDVIKDLYNITNYNDFSNLKNKYSQLNFNLNLKGTANTDSFKLVSGKILFSITLKDSAGKSITQNIVLNYASDISMFVSWK